MKQFIAIVIACTISLAGYTQLPEKAQIKKLGIKKIEVYTGNIISERHYDKQGYEIKLVATGKVISESKIHYNKLQKPDSIITTHSISGVEKKIYQYAATGNYRIITIIPTYNRRDTLFLDKNDQELRQTWSTGQKTVYKYNSSKLLTQITETKPNGEIFYSNFDYDQKGRKINYKRISGANKIETQVTYTYNADGRLLKESQADENGVIFMETNYQYNGEKGLPSVTTGKFMKTDTRTSYEYYFF